MATSKAKKATEIDTSDIIAENNTPEKIDMTKTSQGVPKINDYAQIYCKSNTFGGLNYIDKKTGTEVEWELPGDVQILTMGDLRSMKQSQSSFFKNQWIIMTGFADEFADKFEIADIYKALGVMNYYKEIIEPSNFEEVCTWDVATIKKKVAYMSEAAKRNLAVALNTYIEKGILDSIKAIKAFEEALNCDLDRPE